MSFFKKHLFFAMLIASVLVVCGGLLGGVVIPKLNDNRKRIEQRRKVDQEIKSLRNKGVNQKQMQVQKGSVTKAKDEYAKLTTQAEALNRQGMETLSITIEIQGAGKKIPVFPVDKAVHERHLIPRRFLKAYEEAMDAELARLSPTVPPTFQEIQTTAARQERLMDREDLAADEDGQDDQILPVGVTGRPEGRLQMNVRGDAQPPAVGMPSAMPGMPPGVMVPPGVMPGMMPGAMPGAIRTGGRRPGSSTIRSSAGLPSAGGSSSAEAERRAIELLKFRKAKEHPFYASKADSFDCYRFPDDKVRPEDMWKATVNYWLHQHIVTAILRANDEALRQKATQGDEPSIMNAAVKHLVGVQIGSPGRDIRSLTYYEGERDPPQVIETAGRGLPMAPRSGRSSKVVTPLPDTLTQRACNKDYDVVPLELTVVANLADLEVFMTSLTDRGFFTILETNLLAVGLGGVSADPEQRARSTPQGDLYYYGPDPVMEVTLRVEAVFFSDWHRKLMPVEMLKRLPTGALRDVDRQRISPKGKSSAGRKKRKTR